MTTETNRIEYKHHLSDALKQEAVAFLNSGGGISKILKSQIFSREDAKARSLDTTLNQKQKLSVS